MRVRTNISMLLSLALLAFPAAGFPGERTLLDPGTSDGEIVHMHPGKVDPSLLPLDSVQDLHTTRTPPEVDLNAWRLMLTRDEEELLSLPYRRITRMETVKKKVLLIYPGWFADYAEWEGVPLTSLLDLAGARDVLGGKWVKWVARIEVR